MHESECGFFLIYISLLNKLTFQICAKITVETSTLMSEVSPVKSNVVVSGAFQIKGL